MDILTIVASITGILSFCLTFIDKFEKWKKYFIYYTCFSIGIAGGIFMVMSNDAIENFSQEQVIYLIALVSVISLMIVFTYKYLNHTNDSFGIAIIILVGIGYFSVRLLNSVEKSQSFIKSSDYIILSRYYYNNSDYSRSADFLEKYKNIETINLPEKIIDSLENQVVRLRYKSFNNIR